MSVSKYKILIPLDDKQINIPIEMKWDFTERDQAIDRYQSEVINNLVGPVNDFELIRFSQ